MDPITLFALANGAVSAVKAGCKLYKDIKGAAGEVKEVLKDLDDQFHKLHPPEKPATTEQRNQYVQERNKVVELNKRANAGDHTSVYTEIGEKLGEYYDNFYKCMAIMEEEERRAETEVYHGDASLGKRALQRVLMRKQLEQMTIELRELMVYQSPPELGALYTEVEQMMKHMGQTQRVLIAKQMQNNQRIEKIRKQKQKALLENIVIGMLGIFAAAIVGMAFVYVAQDRIEKYPHLGTDLIPKRVDKIEPKLIYTGR